jgi:MFS family permease
MPTRFCYPPAVNFRPLATLIERISPGLLPRRSAGLRWFFRDALFAQLSGSFYEDFFVLFALASGVAANRIGFIAAGGGLASVLAYLPGAVLASRLRVRKPMVLLTSGGFARLAILALAFLPPFSTGGSAVLAAIIGLRFTTALMGSVAVPSWTTMVADLVPASVRGRFFAIRNATMGILGACASALAGWMVRSINTAASDHLAGYRTAFVVAFAAGMAATFCFSRIPEPPARRALKVSRRFRDISALLRRNPAFAWLGVSSALWGLAVNGAAPFFNVYLVTELGGGPTIVGIGSAIAALSGLAGLLLFGSMSDRKGSRFVLVLTGLAIPFIPCLWAFVRIPWQMWLINIPAGFFWAGYSLASFNLLLEMSPPEDREAGVAVYQTLVALSAVGGPLLASWTVGQVGYVAMFALSGGVRLAATMLFIAFARPAQPAQPA